MLRGDLSRDATTLCVRFCTRILSLFFLLITHARIPGKANFCFMDRSARKMFEIAVIKMDSVLFLYARRQRG